MSFFKLILDSATLWIYIETIWFVLISSFYFSLPWLLYGTLLILVALWFVKNLPTESQIVHEVLGVDPGNFDGNGEYCMRVVAHRGGGHDYPENSLSAFRNVIE